MFDLMQPGLSTMGGFTQSPQGQMALLHFANAALQASQNPNVPSGLGFMNALSQGMMGYKKSELDEAEKAWQGESRQMQREQLGMEKERLGMAKAEHEKSMKAEEDVEMFKPDGSSVRIKESQVPEWTKKGFSIIKPARAHDGLMRAPTSLEISAILSGQYPNNPWGYTPESAKQTLETYKKYYGAESLIQMLLKGALGGESEESKPDPMGMR